MLMLLLNGYVTILQFDVAPMKDTGGTLTLQAALELLLVHFMCSFSHSVIFFFKNFTICYFNVLYAHFHHM